MVVLFAGLFSASVFGFLAQRSLDNSDGFAESMSAALQNPQVKAELQSSVRTEVLDAAQEFGDSEGLFSSLLSGAGAESLADTAARSVDSAAFEEAWYDWALLLHQGLADFAGGQPNSDIAVTGQYFDIKIGPLVTPLLGTGLLANLAGPIDTLIGDRTVVVDTGKDMESRLRLLGTVAGARWFFAAGATLSLALAVFIGPRRIHWLAISLAAAAAGLVVFAIGLALGDSEIPISTTPALNESVSNAFADDWIVLLGVLTAILTLAAVGLGVISRANSPRAAEDQISI
jgi:hypothetical protein